MIWLLHGNLGSVADWEKVKIELETAGYTTRTLNLWKYLECCPKSLTEMGHILCSEIAAQDKHPHICGYSLGGRLAMHALLAVPHIWESAIFISAHPGLKDKESRKSRLSTDTEWAVKCLNLPWREFLEKWDAQPVFSGISTDDRSDIKKWKKSIARAFIDWSLGQQADLSTPLQSCKVPQLWISGEWDKKFTAIIQTSMGEKAIILPKVGHRIPREAPIPLSKLLIHWLESKQHGN